jgi:DNA-binding winged helix-turn-helix (wHTH) protein
MAVSNWRSWLVEPNLNTVSKNGKTFHLEPKVMAVLACLGTEAVACQAA